MRATHNYLRLSYSCGAKAIRYYMYRLGLRLRSGMGAYCTGDITCTCVVLFT